MSHPSPVGYELAYSWVLTLMQCIKLHNQQQHLSNEHSNRATISKSNLFAHSPLSNILSLYCNKEGRHCHDSLNVASFQSRLSCKPETAANRHSGQ